MFVNYDPNTNIVNYYIHDSSLLSKEEIEGGKEVSDSIVLPIEETFVGKRAVFKFDPTSDTLYYEYVNRPLTQEEKQAQKINDLEGAIMELTMIMSMMGGM